MRLLVLLSGLIATTVARPEAPVGYNYPSPTSKPVDNSFVPDHIGKTSTFQFPAGNFGNSDFGSYISNLNLPISGVHSDSTRTFFESLNDYSSGPSVIQSGSPTIHKHVYFHVAPEEPEEIRPRKPILVSAPQKHYKIIFIKAPAPPKPVIPIIPLQPQNEEKTLVYVLVKKPEEAPEIHIPTAAPTQPTKPEVYFIKYGTKKEQIGSTNEAGHTLNNGPDLSTHSEGNNIFTKGRNSLRTKFEETPISFGDTTGNSFAPSVEFSNGSNNQLAASFGETNSAGIAPKYGPPEH